MNRIVVFIGILVILLNLNIEPNDAVVFKLTNFECESYNQSWVVIHTCRLKVMKRNQIGGYFNATILHPASVISVNGQVYKKANGYKPWVVATKFDACRFITNYNYNLIAKVVGVFFLEFTNLNHSCPYNGSQIMNGFYLRPELLTLPLPTGDYKVSIGWYFHKKLQVETNMSFVYIENLMDQ